MLGDTLGVTDAVTLPLDETELVVEPVTETVANTEEDGDTLDVSSEVSLDVAVADGEKEDVADTERLGELLGDTDGVRLPVLDAELETLLDTDTEA